MLKYESPALTATVFDPTFLVGASQSDQDLEVQFMDVLDKMGDTMIKVSLTFFEQVTFQVV